MELYLEFLPKWPVLVAFVFSVIMTVHTLHPIIPFRWVGWGKRNRTSKFDVKDWQGREYYRLCDAAALWAGFSPERPDDPYERVNFWFLALRMDAKSGKIQCENPTDVKWETPISAKALREYATKQGKMPEFLKSNS